MMDSALFDPLFERISKLYFTMDRALEAIGKVMNMMEAYGADRDHDVEKHWRDIKMNQLWLGGKQLCQIEAARWFFECETL